MDITDHIVDIAVIYDNLGYTGLYESTFQFVQRSSQVNRHHFRARNDTVTDFYIREIKRILKDFHFRVQFLFILSIVDATLYEVIQIDFSKSNVGRVLVHFHSEKTKKQTGYTGSELGYRI